MTLCTPADHLLSRRQWLGTTAGAAFASPVLAEAMKKRSKQVLFLWMDGGMSQLESWDPKPNTTFGGPFRSIPTSVPGLHFSELLPKTAKLAHHLAIVRSLCTKDNSHSAGVERIQRGDPKNRGVTYPLFGSAVSKILGPGESNLPAYVWVKPGSSGFITKDAGFLGPQHGAMALGDGKPPEGMIRPTDLSDSDDAERRAWRERADQRYAKRRARHVVEAQSHVFDMAAQLQKQKHLFDFSTFPKKDVERYGSHELGRHALLGRRLLEAGVRFVKVTSYGWDTHGDNFNGHLSLMGKFDQAFSAVIEDLSERKMLDDVLVIAMSEFGRTPRINGHLGRDHWPEAWSLAMAGAGLKKGVVAGKTNAQGTWVEGEEHDIGHLFHTWFQAIGINPKETNYDNAGQPLPIAHDECSIVKEVLA